MAAVPANPRIRSHGLRTPRTALTAGAIAQDAVRDEGGNQPDEPDHKAQEHHRELTGLLALREADRHDRGANNDQTEP